MVVFAAAAAAAAGGTFSWNRDGFFFERELQQKRDFQAQEMHIRQFELYREDIRDLVQLTVRKMDNYLLVNTLQLGFCVTLFTDGRPVGKEEEVSALLGGEERGVAPTWLIGVYAMCNAGAFLYYLLSMWLAMHASISAHSFGVRMLTQCVRLPVPNKAQLDIAGAKAADFENMGFQDVLRIPLWRRQLDNLTKALNEATNENIDMDDDPGEEETNDQYITKLEHVQLFRRLQGNWQAYDAYARVCMALGTNQILHALSYETLVLLNAENRDRWPSVLCVAVFTTCAWIIAKIDLPLSPRILGVLAVLMILPPICACLTLEITNDENPQIPETLRESRKVFIPLVYFFHVLWICFTTKVAEAKGDGVKLPRNFRSVVFLDVFGWLNQTPPAQLAANSSNEIGTIEELPEDLQRCLDPECRRVKDSLQADLERWGNPTVVNWMKETPRMIEELTQIRSDFDEVAKTLGSFCASQGQQVPPVENVEEDAPVWLRLEYLADGWENVEYWYNIESKEVQWEPPPHARISDIPSLRERVENLAQQVSTLVGRPVLQRPQVPREGHLANSLTSTSTARATVHSEREGQDHLNDEARPSNPPHREGSRVSAKPGELPWDTVRRGSRALMLAWLAGVLWTVLNLWFGIKVKFEDDQMRGGLEAYSSVPLRLTARQQKQQDGAVDGAGAARAAWPSTFLEPLGFACAPEATNFGLAVGKYSVQVVPLPHDGLGTDSQWPLSARQSEALESALDRCLTMYSDFRDRGLAGGSLDCHPAAYGHSCEALLLGSDGRELLRCPLGEEEGGEEEEGEGQSQARRIASTKHISDRSSPAKLELKGGPWSSVVASLRPGELWGLSEDRTSVVQLVADNGSGLIFRPHRAVPLCEESRLCDKLGIGKSGEIPRVSLTLDSVLGQLLLLVPGTGSQGPALGSIPLQGQSGLHRLQTHWRRLKSHRSGGSEWELLRHDWRGLCPTETGLWILQGLDESLGRSKASLSVGSLWWLRRWSSS